MTKPVQSATNSLPHPVTPHAVEEKKKGETSCSGAAVGKAIQKGVGVFGDVMCTAEGINKFSKLCVSIIAFVGKMVSQMAHGWGNLSTALKGVVVFLDVADLITRIVEWARCGVSGPWKIASRICLTVYRVFNLIDFLEKVKLIDMSSTVEAIGRIPVLGWIVIIPTQVVGLASFALSLVHNSIQTHKTTAQLRLHENRKKAFEIRKEALNAPDAQTLNGLEKKYEAAVQDIRASRKALKMKVKTESIQTIWENKIGADVNKVKFENCKRIIHNTSVERGKAIVGIISDTVKTLIVSLALVGLYIAGISSSIPMSSLGLVVSSVGLYKCFHDKIAKERMLPLLKA